MPISTLIRYIVTGVFAVLFVTLVVMLITTYNQYREEEEKYIVQGEVCIEVEEDTKSLIN